MRWFAAGAHATRGVEERPIASNALRMAVRRRVVPERPGPVAWVRPELLSAFSVTLCVPRGVHTREVLRVLLADAGAIEVDTRRRNLFAATVDRQIGNSSSWPVLHSRCREG